MCDFCLPCVYFSLRIHFCIHVCNFVWHLSAMVVLGFFFSNVVSINLTLTLTNWRIILPFAAFYDSILRVKKTQVTLRIFISMFRANPIVVLVMAADNYLTVWWKTVSFPIKIRSQPLQNLLLSSKFFLFFHMKRQVRMFSAWSYCTLPTVSFL